jgi:hypothetical protein
MLRPGMRSLRAVSIGGPVAVLALAFATGAAPGRGAEPADRLADEIARWSAFLRDSTATDEIWQQIKPGSQSTLGEAQEALRDGRRHLALLRLAAARANLAAAAYAQDPKLRDPAGFEAEWTRMGRTLHDDLATPSPAALVDVRPAAVRAIGEAALPQARIYYEASLDYGRNTMAEAGLFYMGLAQAQREFAAFCRTLSSPSSEAPPPVRSLRPEIDALQDEVLAAYRPPASIDKHPEFIGVSSTLKEARELDAAGLRYGALLRYLQAALRFAPLRPPMAPLDAPALDERLGVFDKRLSAGGVDHSLGRLFLEVARAEAMRSPAPGSVGGRTVATDILPRYFAALEPSPPRPAAPEPHVTVTLVRWPYT